MHHNGQLRHDGNPDGWRHQINEAPTIGVMTGMIVCGLSGLHQ